MVLRDVFINIRMLIMGQIKGWNPYWISKEVNPSGASSQPDLLRYQSISVLQYGGCKLRSLENVDPCILTNRGSETFFKMSGFRIMGKTRWPIAIIWTWRILRSIKNWTCFLTP